MRKSKTTTKCKKRRKPGQILAPTGSLPHQMGIRHRWNAKWNDVKRYKKWMKKKVTAEKRGKRGNKRRENKTKRQENKKGYSALWLYAGERKKEWKFHRADWTSSDARNGRVGLKSDRVRNKKNVDRATAAKKENLSAIFCFDVTRKQFSSPSSPNERKNENQQKGR